MSHPRSRNTLTNGELSHAIAETESAKLDEKVDASQIAGIEKRL
jgi:hypothetical protein